MVRTIKVLPVSSYSEHGQFPVIQQGDHPIAGYSNVEPYRQYSDVVLFGDHTLSLYKPRFPFLLASDGLKVLASDFPGNDFLYAVLERYKPLSEGYKRHFSILKKQLCSYPSLPEQRRIGEFFSALDDLIAAAERQETLLRQKKQAYLQLMFPCEGETEPRLRFAGFSGDWEQRQLGKVAEVVGGGTPDSSNPRYWDGDIDWYTPSEIGGYRYVDESVRKITHEGLNNSSAKLLPKGSILFTSRASIGLMAFIRRPSSTNQGFQSLVPSKLVDPDFLFAFGPFITRYAKTHAAGSTFVEISGKSLGKTPLALPTIPEQRLIGQFFKTLDSLIAAAEKRTKHLHALKGSYLQRMFV